MAPRASDEGAKHTNVSTNSDKGGTKLHLPIHVHVMARKVQGNQKLEEQSVARVR